MTANVNVNTNRGWINGDTLRVKFPQDAIVAGKAGTYSDLIGDINVTSFDVGYADIALGTDGTHCFVLDYDFVLPVGAVMQKAEFFVTTAWDSASSDVTLNFGTIQRSDFTTIIDTDGILAAVAKTVIDLAGNLVVGQAAGSYPDITTYSGAQLGTATTLDAVIVGYWGNHVPTAGAGKLRIYWSMPGA